MTYVMNKIRKKIQFYNCSKSQKTSKNIHDVRHEQNSKKISIYTGGENRKKHRKISMTYVMSKIRKKIQFYNCSKSQKTSKNIHDVRHEQNSKKNPVLQL